MYDVHFISINRRTFSYKPIFLHIKFFELKSFWQKVDRFFISTPKIYISYAITRNKIVHSIDRWSECEKMWQFDLYCKGAAEKNSHFTF